ncbi:hypothetical protein [Streptomyces sp. NPDC002671]
MSIASAAFLAPARAGDFAGTVAVVAPYGKAGYAAAFARRGWRTVAVDLSARQRPGDLADATVTGLYAASVQHTGGLRRTVKALRGLGVSAVVAETAAGVELAERIAWQLDLPGSDPATSALRHDRGAQAEELERAGMPVPRGIRTTSLTAALDWAEGAGLPGYVLAPSAAGAPVEAAVCGHEFQISMAWPAMRRAAARHSGRALLLLREELLGREYVVNSVTRAGADGRPEHIITDIWAETRNADGRLDRTDLLHRTQLLTWALSRYTRRVLDVLGVVCGPVTSRLAYGAGRGPLLISALAVPSASPADDALRAATGRTHVTDALDAWVPPALAELAPAPSGAQVVRVHLDPGADGAVDPGLGRILHQLPTVVAVSDALRPQAGTAPPAGAAEVVLSGQEAEAIEADYRVIRALEREGLYRAGSR